MINSRIRAFVRLFALCVLMGATDVVLRADITGTILGTVRDASGASMPNVTITVTNTETSLLQTARTDTSGRLSFPGASRRGPTRRGGAIRIPQIRSRKRSAPGESGAQSGRLHGRG